MTREELEQKVTQLKGEGSTDVPAHPHIENVPAYPPPAQRDYRREIWQFVYDSQRWVSRAEIAESMGLKASEWLIGKIELLVNQGYLIREEVPYRPGMTKKWYRVK